MLSKKTITLTLLACLLWGSAFPTLKTMYTIMNVGPDYGIKMLLAGIRFVLAGVMILTYYSLRFKALPLFTQRKAWGSTLVLGMFQTGLMYAFYYIGIYNIPGVKASILSQVSIFLVVILSHFIYANDRLHWGKVIGLVLGLSGIVAVNISQLGSGTAMMSFSMMGEGILIMSSIFSAFSTFYVKKLSRDYNPILLNGWQILLGGAVLMMVGGMTSQQSLDFSHVLAIPLLLYSAIISSSAFTMWYILLQKNRASDLSMIRFSIPIFGSVLSAVFLPGEYLSINILVSLLLVASGIYICNKPVKVMVPS